MKWKLVGVKSKFLVFIPVFFNFFLFSTISYMVSKQKYTKLIKCNFKLVKLINNM